MNISTIIGILVIHWVADFVMQDEEWSKNKSKHWQPLVIHTLVYSNIWLVILVFIQDIRYAAMFWIITFITHTAIDYVTSRITSKKFAEGKYSSSIPNFQAFTVIGFDQLLHYVQLILTWKFLFN